MIDVPPNSDITFFMDWARELISLVVPLAHGDKLTIANDVAVLGQWTATLTRTGQPTATGTGADPREAVENLVRAFG